jgi:hypothetical protein
MQNMRGPRSATLADILERVLETGIVIAGDIKVNLNDVELLTVQIRLIICSVDKADEMGMDWWKSADFLQAQSASGGKDSDAESEASAIQQEQFDALNARLDRLEKTMRLLADDTEGPTLPPDADAPGASSPDVSS